MGRRIASGPEVLNLAIDTATKLPPKTATEIGKLFPLGDEAKDLLREGMTPRQYLDALLEKQHYIDALRFLAHALPKREAVWWACLCVRGVAGAGTPPPQTAALQAAERWVADPSEANRQACQGAAEAAGHGLPASCAAMAAFWSGGSMAPPNTPVVPPGETLTAHGAAGAALLAAVATEPQKVPEKQRMFLTQGLEVLAGTNRWKEALKQEPAKIPDKEPAKIPDKEPAKIPDKEPPKRIVKEPAKPTHEELIRKAMQKLKQSGTQGDYDSLRLE
jgi:hypothetical protein